MDSDEALLASWRDGDQRAGRALFARHVDRISRFFFSKVSNGVDDLVQRSFLALLERSRDLPAGVPVRAYLFGIARNLLLRRFRDEYRDGRHFDELSTSVADLGATPSVLIDKPTSSAGPGSCATASAAADQAGAALACAPRAMGEDRGRGMWASSAVTRQCAARRPGPARARTIAVVEREQRREPPERLHRSRSNQVVRAALRHASEGCIGRRAV